MIECLALDEILETHREQIRGYGGSDGVRDLGLLQPALAQPSAAFGGVFLRNDICERAAAYLFHLVQNHPFIDRNKRVGLEAALRFLGINDYAIEVSDDELIDLVLATAQGQTTKSDIAEFFGLHAA